MNVALLIDSMVRQMTVLLAQLATMGGARTPVADLADQVFRDLADELHRQGVSRKVAADMFGMALRTYRRRLQRFAESQTLTGRSLWEAVYEHVAARNVVTREELLRRFHRDDEPTLKAVLQDLVDSNLLYRSGRGAEATYRAVSQEDRASVDARSEDAESTDTLVWGAVYRAPGAEAEALIRALPLSQTALHAALGRLVESGKIRRISQGGKDHYEADGFVVPLGAPVGWEAAVFDHFQAVVGTILARLRGDSATATGEDRVGGSTYTFEVWPGHPHEEEVMTELGTSRARLTLLRERVAAFNERTKLPRERLRVVVYGGQNVFLTEETEDDDDQI
jgi:hypothetical protein